LEMFRTEILIDGELHRTVRGSRDEAIEFARQVVLDYVGSYVVTKAGPERDLTEALLDHDGCAWADVALPVTAVEYEKCPSCDVMGAWGRDYCEACGHEA
jgi:hypothetical protein